MIDAYGGGRFRIGGETYSGAILVLPTEVVPWNARDATNGLSRDALAAVLALGGAVSILLVGCGKATTVVPSPLRTDLRAAGLVVEAMDTGAACRTYNVLLAEARPVAAALLPVD